MYHACIVEKRGQRHMNGGSNVSGSVLCGLALGRMTNTFCVNAVVKLLVFDSIESIYRHLFAENENESQH